MDQTEGLNDAPGPSDYAETDVPQIPNANHSSIILSRKTLLSLGFLFFPPLPFTAFTSFSHADNPKNTNSTDTYTGT